MNSYKIMKEKHQKEFNDFPMFFAFDNKQFGEGMKKFGLGPTDTDKVYGLSGTGGFYRKSDAPKLHEMFRRQDEEMKDMIAKDDKFVYDMFYYELGNYEYSYTGDVSDTLDALGLTENEVNSSERLLHALQKACEAQMENA